MGAEISRLGLVAVDGLVVRRSFSASRIREIVVFSVL